MAKLTKQQLRLLKVYKNQYVGHGLREGQSYMNALYDISPTVHDSILATDADCFYNDNKITKFFKELTNDKQETA